MVIVLMGTLLCDAVIFSFLCVCARARMCICRNQASLWLLRFLTL